MPGSSRTSACQKWIGGRRIRRFKCLLGLDGDARIDDETVLARTCPVTPSPMAIWCREPDSHVAGTAISTENEPSDVTSATISALFRTTEVRPTKEAPHHPVVLPAIISVTTTAAGLIRVGPQPPQHERAPPACDGRPTTISTQILPTPSGTARTSPSHRRCVGVAAINTPAMDAEAVSAK